MSGANKVNQVKKRRNWIWVALILILIVAGLIVGIPRIRDARLASGPQTGEIVSAFMGDLASNAAASGQLEAQQESDLALEVSGRVEKIFVRLGDLVREGDALVVLETTALERSVHSAEQAINIQQANLDDLLSGPSDAEIKAAEAALASAQAQLDDLLDGPNESEIAAAQANLRAAEANVWGASEQVDQIVSGASQAEIAAAEANLFAARVEQEAREEVHQMIVDACFTLPDGGEICPAYGPIEEQARFERAAADQALAAAQAQYDEVTGSADPNVLAAAQANRAAAVAQRDAAQAQLDLLYREPDTAQIASIQAQLAQARANLAALHRGPADEQLVIATAQLEQARIALEQAKHALEKATLRAPFDGVVTWVFVTEGEWASGPAITLVNPQSLQVVLNVDEVDVGALELEQSSVVYLETWPDRELTGTVVSIAPKANVGGDIVTFEVHLSLETLELPVRAGMTANADFVTDERENVLLVPNRAISVDRTAGKYYVNRIEGDEITQIEVSIGLRDRLNTEVRDGLVEGDQVMIGVIDNGIDFTQGPPSYVREMEQ